VLAVESWLHMRMTERNLAETTAARRDIEEMRRAEIATIMLALHRSIDALEALARGRPPGTPAE
jgi:hypothetical protein